MAQEPISRLIRSLHKLAQPPGSDRLGDDQLLERFVSGRDQAAFELLLWRHGPMVLGVCRRILPAADTEDAFQATWLTFVKKAASIVHREAIGSWLYQVAYRVAVRARAELAKRATQETHDLNQLAAPPASDATETRELGHVLDEEVNRLPARQRAAFILCCLEGRTGEEAARELGCAAGTISSRLTRARERLRQRLSRRGLAPAVALSSVLAGDASSSPVSAALADTTVRAVKLFSSGEAVGGVLSRQAVTLAEGVLRAMFVAKLKIAALMILAAGVLATGGVVTHHALTAALPQEKEQLPQLPKPYRKAEAAPAPAPPKIPKELLEKRFAAIQAVYRGKRARITGSTGLPIELFGWSERWLDAEIELSDKKADHLAALQAHVDRTRELDGMLTRNARTGQGRREDAAAGTYERINAEIRFFQATGKLPPKAVEKAPQK